MLRSLTGAIHLLTLPNGREALLVWLGVLISFWDQSLDSVENGRQLFRQDKTQEESALPQGRGDSPVLNPTLRPTLPVSVGTAFSQHADELRSNRSG